MYLVDNACQKKGVNLACFQASHKAPILHSMKFCAFRYTENDKLIILVQPYSLSNVSMSPQTLKLGRIIPPQETGPHIADSQLLWITLSSAAWRLPEKTLFSGFKGMMP